MKINDYILQFYNEISYTNDPNIIHRHIQDKLCLLASNFGLTAIKEYRCDYYRNGNSNITKGRIDIVWIDDKSNIIFACEIDSHVRAKSYRKQDTINSKYKLWFYFGEECDKFYNTNKRHNISNSIKVLTVKF